MPPIVLTVIGILQLAIKYAPEAEKIYAKARELISMWFAGGTITLTFNMPNAQKITGSGPATGAFAYVCRGTSCAAPLASLEALVAALDAA